MGHRRQEELCEKFTDPSNKFVFMKKETLLSFARARSVVYRERINRAALFEHKLTWQTDRCGKYC